MNWVCALFPLSLSLSRSGPPSSPLCAQPPPRVPQTISTMRAPAKSHLQSVRVLCIRPVCRDSHAHALTTPDLVFAITLVPRVAAWQWQWQQHERRERALSLPHAFSWALSLRSFVAVACGALIVLLCVFLATAKYNSYTWGHPSSLVVLHIPALR